MSPSPFRTNRITGGALLGRAVARGYALCMLVGALVLALLVMAG